jgi:hypothetical protein
LKTLVEKLQNHLDELHRYSDGLDEDSYVVSIRSLVNKSEVAKPRLIASRDELRAALEPIVEKMIAVTEGELRLVQRQLAAAEEEESSDVLDPMPGFPPSVTVTLRARS